ncbi:MAG TPA: Hsp70 family protein [Acidimicrobiales bacterium]|nr:Hsp70 family protein [Acidimicrobiales bacterium]
MSDWQLGIDFGTSYTVAAVARDGSAAVVDVESNGSSRLASSVYLTEDDEVVVGTAALHQAVFGPERFEPTPKRAIGEGEIFLGDRLVPVTELVAAVLRRVYTETCRQQGETAPTAVRVTHPADWSDARLEVLREAIEQAGISGAVLIPEPVAAAARIADATPPGGRIAVYDFGGGTFDAAVLLRTDDGFQVAGPPAGRDPLGGEDIDQRIVTYLGTLIGEEDETWLSLLNPADTKARHDAAGLRAEVRRAKETLSEVSACQLWIPGLDRAVQLTRAELEKLITPDIDATVDTLEAALKDAAVQPSELAGLYLVGGSSRIPLVADTLWRRFNVKPSVQDNPKSVVALGAAGWAPVRPPRASTPRGPSPAPAAGPPVAPTTLGAGELGRSRFCSYLAVDTGVAAWAAGTEAVAQLVLDRPGGEPATVRWRDEPAAGRDTEHLAGEVGAFRASRTSGYAEMSVSAVPLLGRPGGIERRFRMRSNVGELVMVERYLVAGGRAYVLATQEYAVGVLDDAALGPDAGEGRFAARLELPFGSGWVPAEQLVVKRRGTLYSVLVEHTRPASPAEVGGWLDQKIASVAPRMPNMAVIGRVASAVIDTLSGEIATLRWLQRGSPMLTKVGVAIAGGEIFSVVISVPHTEQNQFASLAHQIHLNPRVVAPA